MISEKSGTADPMTRKGRRVMGAKRGLGAVALVFALGAWGGPAHARFTCPVTGGDLVFGQEAKVNSLDQHASSTISTRNIAMHVFEALMTRSEDNEPILELAERLETSDDGKVHKFTLRKGIVFHNGKPLTSKDVVASFNRYAKVGIERVILNNVESWEAPDEHTFVIRMKVAQPTFIEDLSSFSVPIVITPAENTEAPPLKMEPIGTGPFQFVEFVPDSHVKLKRFDGYKPNPAYSDRTGFGGYKLACLDSVTFRIVTEPGARVAGLETGELHAVEDVPQASVERLKKDPNIRIVPYEYFWIHIATPNFAKPPTDNPLVRRAIQIALDMDEIMEAATDGAYKMDFGFQQPGRRAHTDRGKEFFNVKDPGKAKELLKQAGYKGEELVLLTNKDYTSMYNAALVMAEQLKAIGMNVRLEVQDWPATIATRDKNHDAWNYHFTGWGTNTALGYLAVFKFLARPKPIYNFKNPDDTDKVFDALYEEMISRPTLEQRLDAFARLQYRVMENGLALPFGWLTKNQAVRANVKNFVPFRIPRMYNVWMEK
ncbi:MAG: ABC transporter substrate-binding protein [Geminicoccaceae bacterium]|nr:ABC transporter substrate-binding protein [Geminicoccaceae bacterium]MDW8125968.1 ABC transporter substrate-binding protein [Geminicoccaceae bacterium]MDW8341938.1 ABC transporter substrate-binding protein [Geminicoccaceae bacterium]